MTLRLPALTLTIALTAAAAAAAAAADYVHPFAIAQPEDGATFYAVIEIPEGDFTKYEISAETGLVFVDRYQSMPVVYPANYGSIPSSRGGDGDPLDALVITREPIVPGAYIEVRAIGVLHMIDGGEEDDKIIAVPASDIDPFYDNVQDITDLPTIQIQQIEQFFSVYKRLPEGRKIVELNGYSGANAAQDMVVTAIEAHRAQ